MTPATPTAAMEQNMQTISYTALRNHLAQALEAMESGTAFCVTRRGHADVVIQGTAPNREADAEALSPPAPDTGFRREDML